MRYHFTPVKMVSINKSTKCWQGVEKVNPHALLVGMQIAAVIMENSMEIPQKKIKNKTT